MMKMISKFCLLLSALIVTNLHASQELDREHIKAMAGCYEISFQNAETFLLDQDTEMRPAQFSGALEWVTVDSESQKQIELQHLLITPHGIVKHWRQLWDKEATELISFQTSNTWRKQSLSQQQVQGEWTQRVYQVDDSPRYECSAPWIHTRTQNYWECRADAPLPRREFSTRSDYNVLERRNRHQQASYGWVHEQDNTKIVREEGQKDKALVQEKGMNLYKKVADEKCLPAKEWWDEHRPFWKEVQQVWSEIYQEAQELHFKDGLLWQKLFELDHQWAQSDQFDAPEIRKQAKEIIEAHLR